MKMDIVEFFIKSFFNTDGDDVQLEQIMEDRLTFVVLSLIRPKVGQDGELTQLKNSEAIKILQKISFLFGVINFFIDFFAVLPMQKVSFLWWCELIQKRVNLNWQRRIYTSSKKSTNTSKHLHISKNPTPSFGQNSFLNFQEKVWVEQF